MDVFTRCIQGGHLGSSLDQNLTLRVLECVLTHETPVIHHTDQIVQYAATAYTAHLQAAGVHVSMAWAGPRGKSAKTGYAERLMRTIKEEKVDLSGYEDYADTMRQLGWFLDEVYMRMGIHSSLGYLTPAEFETNGGRNRHVSPIFTNHNEFSVH